ncbi:myb-like protein Q isoform X2 [Diprion similis]|uniref:myb-like protein Q isoform X2 n=1 Tax=Diprion similis TaxID=362088 RepID=UPI001EF850A1|nr:myb-like protein Q isoform X2 [Diprion similis]
MAINWVRWLLATCVCASLWSVALARYKYRNQQPPIYKKSWPTGPRISMGNSVHMNAGPPGYKPNYNRPIYKPTNYRYPPPNPVRRPAMFGAPPSWKSQSMMGPLSNQGSLPQRGPVKEFHSMNKVTEYSPEYRPDQAMSPPSHHAAQTDDDKGPIHTIPAPNLGPADKPFNLQSQGDYPQSPSQDYMPSMSPAGSPQANVFGASPQMQRVTVAGSTSPSPIIHRYEVTETNEIGHQDFRTSAQPGAFLTPDFDVGRLTAGGGSAQNGDVFAAVPSNTALVGFGQSNGAMQTNLHSSLHVGFPGQGVAPQSTDQQRSPELHVGHPAPADPPLSANQLYDLLNSFPQQLGDQYSATQQQQQQQQQLDQLFPVQFSQPQMHSFNYDEQANKLLLQQQQQQQQQQLQQLQQQHQNIFVDRDYGSGRVTADYSLEPDARDTGLTRVAENSENSVLDTGYEDVKQPQQQQQQQQQQHQGAQSTYFAQVGGPEDGSLSTQFYTTLPSREAAEKLAALAAAGNVNSHLLGQLRKQQGSSSLLPPNHKEENYEVRDPGEDEESRYQEIRYIQQQQQRHRDGQRDDEAQGDDDDDRQNSEDKRPLRIMVPDLEDYGEDEAGQRNFRNGEAESNKGATIREEYEYEDNQEEEQRTGNIGEQEGYGQNQDSEFGSRIATAKNQ